MRISDWSSDVCSSDLPLRALDTPTICNALEVVAPERRGYGYTVDPLFCAFPKLPPIAGYARRATNRAMRPSGVGDLAARDVRIGYYEYASRDWVPKIAVSRDPAGRPPRYRAGVGGVRTDERTVGTEDV